MNFMKMRTFFYKKNTSFYNKMPIVIYKKNSMLQIVIYKKINFWEEYTPLTRSLSNIDSRDASASKYGIVWGKIER